MGRSVVLAGAARCPRCSLPPRWCTCDMLPPVETQLTVQVLIHRLEQGRPSSTGKLVGRAVAGAVCHIYERGNRFFEATGFPTGALEPGRQLWVLHPSGEPLPEPAATQHSGVHPPPNVLLLDGSWRQARYHGVFAPNHRLRKAVTALAIGNIGKHCDTVSSRPLPRGEGGGEGASAEGDPHQKPRSHDTSRIAWARLMARMGEEFPLQCPNCGGDIRLIAFITEPGPIRKILTHLGEPLEPPPLAPARGPPADWGELVQASDDRDVFQASPDDLPVIDIHSL